MSLVRNKQAIDANAVPAMLRRFDQWVCWKYVQDQGGGRRRKVPVNPKSRRFASVKDRSTWTGIDEAILTYSRHLDELDGIGFVFTMDDPFIGIDLDDCRNPTSGNLSFTAYEILGRIPTYTEVSPSGTGLKAIATIDSVIPSRRRSDPDIEIYSSGRFFTITTLTIDGDLRIRDATDGIADIQSLFFDDPADLDKSIPLPAAPSCASDHAVLGKAMSARNGEKFRELWGGSSREFNSNQSQADLSLCRLLAFWCGPCVDQIDRLFRSSGLFRSKWDERHFSSGATYGTETIQRAIVAQGTAFYRWNPLASYKPNNE
jgi:primase-polymerase (primpol)-like protein